MDAERSRECALRSASQRMRMRRSIRSSTRSMASDRLRQFLLLGQRYPLKVNINKTNSKRNKTRPDGIFWTAGAAKGGGEKKSKREKLRA